MQLQIGPKALEIIKTASDAIAVKKPSDLDTVIEIDGIHPVYGGNGIGCYCPDCGLLHKFMIDIWPIDIPIVCGNDDPILEAKCECRFIIRNDTPIED